MLRSDIEQTRLNEHSTYAIKLYADGMAYLGKNQLRLAQSKAKELAIIAQDEDLKNSTIWGINTMYDLVQIAHHILQSGIALQQNKIKTSLLSLQKAIKLEDQLNYNEPPDWFFSVRHYLGAVLLSNRQYAEAEKIYLEDLNRWKRNGWSLMGLYQSLLFQDKKKEAIQAKKEFDEAWKYADVELKNSSVLFSLNQTK